MQRKKIEDHADAIQAKINSLPPRAVEILSEEERIKIAFSRATAKIICKVYTCY